MSDESVIFEIQVDRKLLEQVFTDNKHLKDRYDRLIKSEESVKTLKDQIANLENEAKKYEETIYKLKEENARLKGTIDLLALMKHNQEKDDNKVTSLVEEMYETKQQLLRTQTENEQLDKDNLNLQQQVKILTRKQRLQEEKNKSNDLAHVECKLLKLKLQTIEKEKKYLLEEFENERKIITTQNKPKMAKIEENLKHLRQWMEKETKERRSYDSDEVKALKAQIHALEKDKIDLSEGFELERKVFRKILKANTAQGEKHEF